MLEKKFPDYTIKISVDTTELDCAIEKTRQLVALMKEQQKLAASFFVSGGELRRIKERTNQAEDKLKCPNCKVELSAADNFCSYCGTKLKRTCNCWVKKNDNYDCGESSCPGLKLLIPK